MARRKGADGNATLADVAALAGVSVSAVSKALLGGGGKTTKVSEATAGIIREAAGKLGYSPNSAARQLKTGKSNIVGALIHSSAPQIYYDLFARIQKKLARMGYCFMIGQSDGSVELIARYLEEFRSRKADLIISALYEYPEHTRRLEDLHARFDNILFLGKPELPGRGYFEIDIKDGIIQIVGHLASMGIKRIAIDILNKAYRASRMRIEGYVEGLRRTGIEFDDTLVLENIVDSDQEMIKTAGDVTRKALDLGAQAIIAGNDLRAIMIIKYLRTLGVDVPRDVKVTGFDNMDFAPYATPALTTVDPRNEEQADAAVAMARFFLAEGRFPGNSVIKPKLVIGEST